MAVAIPVNVRWIFKSVAHRQRAPEIIEPLFAGSGITWEINDSLELGGVGLPRWSVVIFRAQHGDFELLDRDVAERILRHEELARYIEPLTPESRW
jgi:hypothetical protein